VGSSYEIDINISGRAWENRHFVSLKAWKVNSLDGGEQEVPLEYEEVTKSSIKDSDMPF
jgi:hypothetical protein